MRVIFGTTPRPTAARLKDGSQYPGVLFFQAQLWSPGEEGSQWGRGSHRPLPTAGTWLKQVNSRDKIVIVPPPEAVDTPPVEIPAALLRTLPADAQVTMEWNWLRTRP